MKTSLTPLHQDLAALLPDTLHAACQARSYKKGEVLFAMGDKPQAMFFVESGEVVLQRMSLQGDAVVLQRASRGFVAEASLQSVRYHCDARVVAASHITHVGLVELQEAMATDPIFAQRWILMLNSELRRLRLQCERLALNRVQDRLLHLIETEGTAGHLPMGAGLKSLAGQIGVTHEALYRCVAGLVKAQRLQRSPQGLFLVNSA